MTRDVKRLLYAMTVVCTAALFGGTTAAAEQTESCDDEGPNGGFPVCIEITNCAQDNPSVIAFCMQVLDDLEYDWHYNNCTVDTSESFIRCDSEGDCSEWEEPQKDYIKCKYMAIS